MNNSSLPSSSPRIPLWLKLLYTAFMAVLIPVYWHHYGLTNFLFFCDIALLLTLAGIWKENALLVSMAAVGILLPQTFWCVDFMFEAFGTRLSGMTTYMFDEQRPLYLRGLSLFHGWLPFLLLFLVSRLGYAPRSVRAWTTTAIAACSFSFLFLPAPGNPLPHPQTPVNVNYVFGMSETERQTWMPPGCYLVTWIAALFFVVYLPTHKLLTKFFSVR